MHVAYGRSGGMSNEAMADLEGTTCSDAGFTKATATSTVGSLKQEYYAAGLDAGTRRTAHASDPRDADVAARSAGVWMSKLSVAWGQ